MIREPDGKEYKPSVDQLKELIEKRINSVTSGFRLTPDVFQPAQALIDLKIRACYSICSYASVGLSEL